MSLRFKMCDKMLCVEGDISRQLYMPTSKQIFNNLYEFNEKSIAKYNLYTIDADNTWRNIHKVLLNRVWEALLDEGWTARKR